ncbi:winged helix-turn-helix transcriptional regulator [Halobium salinum]|uniref:Winged helix-turn-helix transcriptional regulator n=1 Tax=Halobium salinum TaxID=1364940 RepID=A0ABD5PEW6_9EURY|nr:helix-turn-helix domain-containing protein [Halobium salinum]
MSDADTDADAVERAVEGCPAGGNDEGRDGHPATDLFTLLGRAHAVPILAHLVHGGSGAWRFSELESALDVAPNTLTTRLQEFAEAGLVERRSYDEIPPRVEYQATDRARDLDPVFRALHDWMDDHGEPALGVVVGDESASDD